MKYIVSLLLVLTAGALQAARKTEAPAPQFEQGFSLKNEAGGAPSYNAPAELKVNNFWECFATASFIYWNVDEEALDLAISASLVAGNVNVVPVSTTLLQDSNYQPGFKVGIGADTRYDDWGVGLEYTWLHQKTETSSTAPDQTIGQGVWFITNWFIQPNGNGDTPSATSLTSQWKTNIDFLDAYLNRPYYQGRSLTVAPFAGVRAAWIRQSLHIEAIIPLSGTSSPLSSRTSSNCWGVGPRVGLQGHWLVGSGFRVESDAAASVLYTRYTTLKHSEDATESNTIPVAAKFPTFGCLRPIAELGLGLGWGRYFKDQKYAFDFLAAYSFSLLWSQNMMRRLVDLQTQQINASANDLYLHGLTLTARFDF